MPTRVKSKNEAERPTRTTKDKRKEGGKISLREYIKDGEERLETVYVEPEPKQAPCITLCSATDEETDGIEMNLSFLDIEPKPPKVAEKETKIAAERDEAEKEEAVKEAEKEVKIPDKKSMSKKKSAKINKTENRDESPSKKRFSSPLKMRLTNSTSIEERDSVSIEENPRKNSSKKERASSPLKERPSSRLKSKSSYAESFAAVTKSRKKDSKKKESTKKDHKKKVVKNVVENVSTDEDTLQSTNAESTVAESTVEESTIAESTNADTSIADTATMSATMSADSATEGDTEYDHSTIDVKSKKKGYKKAKKPKGILKQSSSLVSDPDLDKVIEDLEEEKPKSKKASSPPDKSSSSPGSSVNSSSVKSGMFAYSIKDLIKGNDMKHAAVKTQGDMFAYTVEDLISSPRTNTGLVQENEEKKDEVDMVSPIASPRKADDVKRTLDFEPTDFEAAEVTIPALVEDEEEVEDVSEDEEDEESAIEKKKRFSMFRRSKKTKALKPKKTNVVSKKKKKDSKKSKKVEKKEKKTKKARKEPEEEEETANEDAKEVMAMVATPEKSEAEESVEEQRSVQESSVQSLQNSIISKNIKKSKFKFSSVLRRGKKSKKVKVPKSPTRKSKKSPTQKSKKINKVSPKKEASPEKDDDVATKEEIVEDAVATKEEIVEDAVATKEEIIKDVHDVAEEVAEDVHDVVEEVPIVEEEPVCTPVEEPPQPDEVASPEGDIEAKEPSEGKESPEKTIVSTLAEESIATPETTNITKTDSPSVVSKSTVTSKKSRTRQLSGKLKRFFSGGSVAGSIATNRGGYSVAGTAAPSVAGSIAMEREPYGGKNEGRPPLPTVASAVSAAESVQESVPAIAEHQAEEKSVVTAPSVVAPSIAQSSVAPSTVANTLVTSESKAYVEKDLRSLGTAKQPEMSDKVERFLDVDDNDKFEYMPDVVFTSFSNSTCNDDKYGCDASVTTTKSEEKKGKSVILRNVDDVAGFELDLVDSKSVKKNDSMSVSVLDRLNPFKKHTTDDASLVENSVQEEGSAAAKSNISLTKSGSIAKSNLPRTKSNISAVNVDNEEIEVPKSPSVILDVVEQTVDNNESGNLSALSVGRTSSKLSLGSKASKKSSLSNAKSMERSGSKLSTASKGSRSSRISGRSTSKLSTSSKTSKRSLSNLDMKTPAVIRTDPEAVEELISPLNMQQDEDGVNDIVIEDDNIVAKGEQSKCGWFGMACQDRFNCFNFNHIQSIAAEEKSIVLEETAPGEASKEHYVRDTVVDESILEAEPEESSVKEEVVNEDIVEDIAESKSRESLAKDELADPIVPEEKAAALAVEEKEPDTDGVEKTEPDTDGIEEKGPVEEEPMAGDKGLTVETQDEDTAAAGPYNFETSSPLKSPSKKKSIFKRSLKFSSPAKSFKKTTKEDKPPVPKAPSTPLASSMVSPKKSISFKIGSPFKSVTSPKAAPLVNEEDLIDSGVVETAVFAASVVLKKGGPASTAKSSASVVLISGLKKGKNLPPKLEKNINKDSTAAASVAVDALGSGIAQSKVVPLILSTLEAKGYKFTPYKPVNDDQSMMSPSIAKSAASPSVAKSSQSVKSNAETSVAASVASPSEAASAIREQKSTTSSQPAANEYVGFKDIMNAVDSDDLATKDDTATFDETKASESYITKETPLTSKSGGSSKKKSIKKNVSTDSETDSGDSSSGEPVPKSPIISPRRSRSPGKLKKSGSPKKDINIYVMDKNKDNKALSRVLASLNLSQDSSSSSD